MYKIEVDKDWLDHLVKKVLVEDYEGMCKEVRVLGERIDRRPYESDDLALDLEFKKAFEVLLMYYFPLDEANRIIRNQKVLDKNQEIQ